jgi:hypothetical protein
MTSKYGVPKHNLKREPTRNHDRARKSNRHGIRGNSETLRRHVSFLMILHVTYKCCTIAQELICNHVFRKRKLILVLEILAMPIAMVTWSYMRNVCTRWNTLVLYSKPIQVMDVLLFCVQLLPCDGLIPVQGDPLPILYRIRKLKKQQSPAKSCRNIIMVIIIIIIIILQV